MSPAGAGGRGDRAREGAAASPRPRSPRPRGHGWRAFPSGRPAAPSGPGVARPQPGRGDAPHPWVKGAPGAPRGAGPRALGRRGHARGSGGIGGHAGPGHLQSLPAPSLRVLAPELGSCTGGLQSLEGPPGRRLHVASPRAGGRGGRSASTRSSSRVPFAPQPACPALSPSAAPEASSRGAWTHMLGAETQRAPGRDPGAPAREARGASVSTGRQHVHLAAAGLQPPERLRGLFGLSQLSAFTTLFLPNPAPRLLP